MRGFQTVFQSGADSDERPILDGAITLTKLGIKIALLHVDPVFAMTAGELLDRTFRGYGERRQADIADDFAWVVEELQKREPQLTIEDLVKNDALMSAVAKDARIEMSTPKNLKREYLRNALLNIAVETMPDETRQQIFLNAVEAFTPAHIRTLKLIRDNKVDWQNQSMLHRSYGNAVGIAVPELNHEDALIQSVLSDLKNRGFSNVPGPDQRFPQPSPVSNLGAFGRRVFEIYSGAASGGLADRSQRNVRILAKAKRPAEADRLCLPGESAGYSGAMPKPASFARSASISSHCGLRTSAHQRSTPPRPT
jgi:hypothetical protein